MKFFLSLMLLLALAFPVQAAETDADENPRLATGQPLPRFASLRTGEVNLRTGPGTRYPIDWVFTHKGLPVEISAEYGIWRRIHDSEGTEGWVHKAALTSKRALIIIGAQRELRRKDDPGSPVVAHLEVGATGQLSSCSKEWCRVKFDGIKGYLRKSEFWGAYANEEFD